MVIISFYYNTQTSRSYTILTVTSRILGSKCCNLLKRIIKCNIIISIYSYKNPHLPMKGKRGWCNNKGNRPLHFFGISCPNQIGKELLGRIGGNPYTRLHHITFGKIVHILPTRSSCTNSLALPATIRSSPGNIYVFLFIRLIFLFLIYNTVFVFPPRKENFPI